jgi:hypothetical protein
MSETKKIQETFCEAYPIFNFLTKKQQFEMKIKISPVCPMPPGMGLNVEDFWIQIYVIGLANHYIS